MTGTTRRSAPNDRVLCARLGHLAALKKRRQSRGRSGSRRRTPPMVSSSRCPQPSVDTCVCRARGPRQDISSDAECRASTPFTASMNVPMKMTNGRTGSEGQSLVHTDGASPTISKEIENSTPDATTLWGAHPLLTRCVRSNALWSSVPSEQCTCPRETSLKSPKHRGLIFLNMC